MTKAILITFGITSIAWCILLCIVAIRNIAKQNELKKLVKSYKTNIAAMQSQFIQWRKQYEKMESGDPNSDFLGSLDILHNREQNGSGKTNAGTADTSSK